jgi:hypothetical protein
MNFYTLRFPSEAEADAVAKRLGYLNDEGELIPLGHNGDIIDIGMDVVVPATYDDDGKQLTPPIPVPGYFINLALPGPLPRSLAPYRVLYGSGGVTFSAQQDPEPGAWPPTP